MPNWKQLVTTDELGILSSDATTIHLDYKDLRGKLSGNFQTNVTTTDQEAEGRTAYYVLSNKPERGPVTRVNNTLTNYTPCLTAAISGCSIFSPFSIGSNYKIAKVTSSVTIQVQTFAVLACTGMVFMPPKLDFGVISSAVGLQQHDATIEDVTEGFGFNGASYRTTNAADDIPFEFLMTHEEDNENSANALTIFNGQHADIDHGALATGEMVTQTVESNHFAGKTLNSDQAIVPVLFTHMPWGNAAWTYRYNI